MMISSGQPFMAVKSQFSNDLAKLRMELVNLQPFFKHQRLKRPELGSKINLQLFKLF
jgi:hypothetical protein